MRHYGAGFPTERDGQNTLSGVRITSKEGDSWTHWTVIDRSRMTREQVRLSIQNQLAASNWYAGPGRSYSHGLSIRRVGRRILLKLPCGVDV